MSGDALLVTRKGALARVPGLTRTMLDQATEAGKLNVVQEGRWRRWYAFEIDKVFGGKSGSRKR